MDAEVGAVGRRIMARLEALARHTAEPDALTRLCLTAAHRDAARTVATWMAEAGLAVRMDAAGNVIGRRDGTAPDQRSVLIGSHIDTVRNAGKYDGALGVVAAIEAVQLIGDAALPFPIEIIAFGDEEGVRFPTALTGSRAIAGVTDPAVLSVVDDDGVTLRDALVAFGGDPDALATAAYRPSDVLAYLELHIEQGPVLEAEGLPVGVVTAIAGAERHVVEATGAAGHAGTVPMELRHDAITAAAEMVLAVEQTARETDTVVATVGQMSALPGAVNVIPSGARFSLDMRSPSDAVRRSAVEGLFSRWGTIAERRGVRVDTRKAFEEAAAPLCAGVDGGARSGGSARRRAGSAPAERGRP